MDHISRKTHVQVLLHAILERVLALQEEQSRLGHVVPPGVDTEAFCWQRGQAAKLRIIFAEDCSQGGENPVISGEVTFNLVPGSKYLTVLGVFRRGVHLPSSAGPSRLCCCLSEQIPSPCACHPVPGIVSGSIFIYMYI